MSEHVLNVLIEGYDPEKAKRVSREEDSVNTDWIDVYASRQNQTILQAEVTGVEEKVYSVSGNKKMPCAIVEIGSVRGLIPLSYLGVETKKEARQFIGNKVAFIVIAIDKENNFFVGSRVAALEEMKRMTLKKIDVDDELIAVVRQVFNSALVVDIGGIQCRIPTSEVSYGWIDSLHDYYEIGDHVKVKVIELDREKGEVKVSIKATKPNVWENVQDYFEENAEYVAKVSGVSEFGTFVELREGISGLAQHLRHETVKKGDKVLVRILKIRPKEQKMNVRIVKVLNRV